MLKGGVLLYLYRGPHIRSKIPERVTPLGVTPVPLVFYSCVGPVGEFVKLITKEAGSTLE